MEVEHWEDLKECPCQACRWHRNREAFHAHVEELNRIRDVKLSMIYRQHQRSQFLLAGYVVLMVAGVVFMNKAVMVIATALAAAIVADLVVLHLRINAVVYPEPPNYE